jgi:3-hydroxyacyl-[acyl-carrier-protein] dehydratase
MHFSLIDRIETLEVGKEITATKCLTMAEEYLGDHFPKFPVMPGVLMLEALTQASAWLIRVGEDFAHSMVVLKEARNVKYGRFVQPGEMLTVTASIIDQTDSETTLKAVGSLEGKNTLRAKLTLRRYNLADVDPQKAIVDRQVTETLREQLKLLQPLPRGEFA